MKILAVDSSGPVAAVALAEETEDGARRLIGGFRLQSGFTHSQTLMPMLETMKELAGIDLAEIDYIAVASGPGSFTGLRIGASAAKGLAFALEKRIVPVPTLDAMAYQMAGVSGLVCPVMDARRSQVYTGVYGSDKTGSPGCGQMEPLLPSCAIPVEELIAELNRLGVEGAEAVRDADETDGTKDKKARTVYLLGDGVPVYLKELREGLKIPYTVAPFHRDRQSAEAVCALAFELVREGKTVDADAFAPEYIRGGPQPAV